MEKSINMITDHMMSRHREEQRITPCMKKNMVLIMAVNFAGQISFVDPGLLGTDISDLTLVSVLCCVVTQAYQTL